MASGRLLLVFFLFSSSCFASSPVSARKVQLALYYETVCPYCSNFIVNYLAKIFENGLIDIIELDLIPYGNAKHGPNECVLNTVEACAISAWPDVDYRNFEAYICRTYDGKLPKSCAGLSLSSSAQRGKQTVERTMVVRGPVLP